MRRIITRAAAVAVASAAATAGLATIASPASADCIEYTQHTAVRLDANFDGNDDFEVLYPPVVTDTNPSDCLTLKQDNVPGVIRPI